MPAIAMSTTAPTAIPIMAPVLSLLVAGGEELGEVEDGAPVADELGGFAPVLVLLGVAVDPGGEALEAEPAVAI